MKLPFDPAVNLSQMFPTFLGQFQYPDAETVMPRVAEVILEKERESVGVTRSNLGGWHSDDTLLRWKELEFAELGETFRSAVASMVAATRKVEKFKLSLKMGAWANVNRAGSHNANHIHPWNHWSGVLYVRCPDLSSDPVRRAGNIVFKDPRGPVTMMKMTGDTDNVQIVPRLGNILLFPSWLYHSVNPFSLPEIRISIAFNARIEEFEPA